MIPGRALNVEADYIGGEYEDVATHQSMGIELFAAIHVIM
jgi:hypothetical protein